MIEVWVTSAGVLVSFLVGWGMMRAKNLELERRVADCEEQSDKQREFIHGLRDVYVTQQHFNEIMLTLRESHRELHSKMEKVIEILTDRV